MIASPSARHGSTPSSITTGLPALRLRARGPSSAGPIRGVRGRHGTASTYHQLGIVAQNQGRFGQTEDHYRRALQAYRDNGDVRSASWAAAALGRLLAEIGRRGEAFTVLLDATLSWRDLTGNFDPRDIRLLTEQRRHLPDHTVQTALDALDPATALRQHLDQAREP
ncbi:tetratricopeptide repeat protein [Nocardia sp. NPDC052112]|uniref:tetratricopeptide repeat protein n=1 Tax=Nocardia sp. NPDC052112 TaxID=3155646 RepID=UPI00341CD1DA